MGESNSSGSSGSFGGPKRVSFSNSDSSNRSSRRSILKTASEQGVEGAAIAIDLHESDLADTEQARRKFTEALRAVEGLSEIDFQDFKMFNRKTSRSVRMVVTKQEEIIVRRTAESWTAVIKGARVVPPKWYAVKVDWIEKSLATSSDSPGISESAQQRFGTENGIEVKRMSWLKRPKDEAQFGTAVVKVATKEEAEKLLRGRPTFGSGSVTVSPFDERRTPKVCYKCQGYGHIARECTTGTRCPLCAEDHEQSACQATSFKCTNCGGPHQAFAKQCGAYKREMERLANLRLNDQNA